MKLTFLRMLEGLRFPAMDAWMQAVTELGSEALFFGCGPGAVLVRQQTGWVLPSDCGFFGTVLNQFFKAPLPDSPALGAGTLHLPL